MAIHHDSSPQGIHQDSGDLGTQQHPADPACVVVANSPGDVFVKLASLNSQTVFRQGEIIDFKAEYSASVTKKYMMTPSHQGIMALPGAELFCLKPNIGRNPLDAFQGAVGVGLGFMGVGGGPFGLSGGQTLGVRPIDVDLELNGWRLLPPGSYQLSIVSRRVFAATRSNPLPTRDNMHPFGGKPITLRSNTVEFQVLKADPDWQAAQLAAAQKVFDSGGSTNEEKQHAIKVLMYLDTEASTRELARRFRSIDEPFAWEIRLGLFVSSYRAAAIQEMKAELKDPRHPITKDLVELLTAMELQSDPRYRLPDQGAVGRDAWTKAYDVAWTEYKRRVTEHLEEAASTLPARSGESRAVTASEVLIANPQAAPEAKAEWRRMLLSSWDSLSVSQQNYLLDFRWEQVVGPEWLPVLQKIVAGPSHPYPHPSDPDRSTALRHIYELSPELGRPLILKEIVAGSGDIDVNVLALLLDSELPLLDDRLVAKIKNEGKFTDYPMIDRYASGRVLPQVKAAYEPGAGRWACSLQTSMLRYFLRVEPDYGVRQVVFALHHRRDTRCYTSQLSALGKYIRIPQLERITFAALGDPSSEVARDAAEALRRFGSADAEAALWARQEQLYRKWHADPDKLVDAYSGMLKDQSDSSLESSLVQAITDGQAWFETEERLRKLQDLCTPSARNAVESILRSLRSREFAISMSWGPNGQFIFNIAWYSGTGITAFREKLAQFPAGSHFKMISTKVQLDAHPAESSAANDSTAAHSQTLQIEMR